MTVFKGTDILCELLKRIKHCDVRWDRDYASDSIIITARDRITDKCYTQNISMDYFGAFLDHEAVERFQVNLFKEMEKQILLERGRWTGENYNKLRTTVTLADFHKYDVAVNKLDKATKEYKNKVDKLKEEPKKDNNGPYTDNKEFGTF
jgi:hypothetical protein